MYIISEMAMETKKIAVVLHSCTHEIILHLIKIYFMKKNQAVHHWTNEIWNKCSDIPKCKSNNKFPTKEFIYENIFGFNDDNFDVYWIPCLDFIKAQYNVKNDKLEDKEKFHQICREYFFWLSEKLSTVGFVLFSEVTEKLKTLMG